MRATRADAWTAVAAVLAGVFSSALAAGEPPPAQVAAPPPPATAAPASAQPAALDAARVRAALASIPALQAIAERFSVFSNSEVDAALRRGDRSRQSIQVWTIMPSTFAWSPVPERTFWVVSGRAGTSALLAVLEARKDGTFANAGSALIDEAETTLAIGASAEYPKQLTWSTCYGCAGEGGTIRFADDGRVELTYR
jgi:hypothetical protein